MSLHDMAAFYRWLSEANDAELEERRQAVAKMVTLFESPETKQEAQYLLRKIEQEIMARSFRQQP